MTEKYPLHDEKPEVHPRGANIKYCPHCMGGLPFGDLGCVIKDKAIWSGVLLIAHIKNCPMCGRKL